MPYPNWHSARLRKPGDFKSIVVLWKSKDGNIMGYGGKLKKYPDSDSELQSIRFRATAFTVAEAKEWLEENKYHWILFEAATGGKTMEGKAFNHNSNVADSEPNWGDVDKNKLPLRAFAWEDPGTERDKVSTWSYPHHWIKNGGDPDDDGRFTTGAMYLHEGGLNAAWAAAQGARSGKKASQEVIAHLEKHRKALGLEQKSKEVIDPHARRVHIVERPQLQAKAMGTAKDPGWVEGYAAVWNNIDFQGDIMRKGSFSKTIQEQVPAGKVKLMARHYAHGGDVPELLGTISKMEEDDYGLWFKAIFSSIAKAQDYRTLAAEGHITATSIGFGPVRWDFVTDEEGKEIREWLECKIYEVTLTVRPANEFAIITGAKSLDLNEPGNILIVKNVLTSFKAELEATETPEDLGRFVDERFGGKKRGKGICESVRTDWREDQYAFGRAAGYGCQPARDET